MTQYVLTTIINNNPLLIAIRIIIGVKKIIKYS